MMKVGLTIFQAMAMNVKLCSTALCGVVVVLVATELVSLDRIEVPNTALLRLKNKTSFVLRNDEGDRDPIMIPIPGGAVGPESFAFGGGGVGPYTGVSDGRIIEWRGNESRWVDFAVTSPVRDGCVGPRDHAQREHICGRPLGLGFHYKTGQLYIADAYMGLQVVGPNGGQASPVATELDGVPFGLTNALDIDQNRGFVYFTDSSTRFPRRNYVSIILSGDETGRLMKFDTNTNETTLLVGGLRFPNGVALSQNGDFLLFVETATCRLFKLWIETRKLEVLVDRLPGFPDNVKRNENGEFWVGINSRRSKFLGWVLSKPWIGNLVVRMSPVDPTRLHSRLARLIGRCGMGIRLDRDGNVVEVLDVGWKYVSEVEEEKGELWIGSVTRSFVVKHKM